MSITALYIVNLVGKPLMSRCYRGSPNQETLAKFMLYISDVEEESKLTPVFEVDDTSFAFIKHKDLYFMTTANNNANISLVFVFLYKLLQVLTDYLSEVEEESIKDNIVIIHELLDETLDFGYPQITESKVLMGYITQEGNKLSKEIKIPPAVTNAVSWRPEGIKYKKNEVFIDVIESVDILANANGMVVCSEVKGIIKINSKLSGMPILRLYFNDMLLQEEILCIDEVQFHQCVCYGRFRTDGDIHFVPPDGEFELLTYRFSTYVKPPIWVECLKEVYPNNKVEYSVKVTSKYKARYTASDVEILIPVPSDVDSPTFKATSGVVSYLPENNVFNWYFKSLPGCKVWMMTAKFGLPSVSSEEAAPSPPVQVRFQITSYNTSGIRVQYLKVSEKSGYVALPWIRYVTQNGDYHIRCKTVLHGSRWVDTKKKLHD